MTARSDEFVIVEVSGLHTAIPTDVAAAMETYRAIPGCALIVHTETTDAHLDAMRAEGWRLFRVREMVLAWRTDTFDAERMFDLRLTDIGWRVGRISRDGVTAACAKLHHLPSGSVGVVYGLHWPSGLAQFLVRLRAHRQVCKALASEVAGRAKRHPERWQIAAGDTNVDHRRASVRRRMSKALGLKDVWSGDVPHEGSHGKRLIDAAYVRGLDVRDAWVLPKNDSSDHRAIAVRVRLAKH